MPAIMRPVLLGFSLLLAASASSSAAVLVTLQQIGSTLVMTATGTYNFTGVASAPDIGIGVPAAFRADSLIFGWETATNSAYAGTFTGVVTGNTNIASANTYSSTIPFYVSGTAGGPGTFFLKDGMPLSGSVNNTATFNNQSFNSLGLTPGQSMTLNLAGGNSLTLSIIPEPSTVLLSTLGVLGLLRRRR